MSKVHNPNDKFFKAAFKYPSLVKDFLEFFLPVELLASLNLSSLALDPTNYIGDALAEYYSDVVYTCTINGKATKIILLFEHKTSIAHDIYIQLNLYILEILKQNYKTHKRYDIVIPIVIYQGTEKFEKRPFQDYFENADPNFIRFIPQFDFELASLQKINDEEILSFSDESPLKGVLLTMKYAQEKSFIKKYFEEILSFSARSTYWNDLFKQILVYLYERTGMQLNEFKALFESQNKNNMVAQRLSLLDELKLEGKIEGKIEGKLEGKIEGKIEVVREAWLEGYSPEAVSKLTKISIEDVKLLYKKFERESNAKA